MNRQIDLRSDTVTRPSKGMLKAMMSARVGDDVYGDDPTVNLLEEKLAEMLGFEAAIFTPSGTQANLISIMSHCGRGDEYIVGQLAHTYRYEAGGAAVLGSIQPQPIEFEPDGRLDLEKVHAKIKPDDVHFARTKLLCLENTQNGRYLPLSYLEEAALFAQKHSLKLHLDGARLFNAAVGSRVAPREISKHFDSVSVCLSKGLGAPVGSVACGTSSFVTEARKWRKMVGGGMRQAGILAAAGIYALDNNIDRLQIDHDNATYLAEALTQFPDFSVQHDPNQTNMVFFSTDPLLAEKLEEFLKKRNILISGGSTTRLVTHLDISREDIDRALTEIQLFFM